MLKIARSTYYSKETGIDLSNQKNEADLIDQIGEIVCEFPGYGTRRVMKHLRREGFIINRKRIQRIMRENLLLCKRKRKFINTTDSNHNFKRYPNLIKNIIITRPNQVWVSDITYIRILTGFIFLAVVIDAFSRKVIGYALSKQIKQDITITALNMALFNRSHIVDCNHHSDQGVQYACNNYINLLKQNNIQISMSRRGNPYDNAIAESFMKTIKYEEVYLWNYETYADVKERIPFFIQEVYNNKRLHSSLDYLPPAEFEENYFEQNSVLIAA